MTDDRLATKADVAAVALRVAAITLRNSEMFERIAIGENITRAQVKDLIDDANALMEKGIKLAGQAISDG